MSAPRPYATDTATVTTVKDEVLRRWDELVPLWQSAHEFADAHEDYLRFAEKYRYKAHAELLNELSDDYAFQWAQIAKIIGVSIPAIRKWRNGGAISEENHTALAELVAFAQALRSYDVEWPGDWMNRRVRPDRDIRWVDLLRHGDQQTIFGYLRDEMSAEQALDVYSPDWREGHSAARTGTGTRPDGSPVVHFAG